MASHNSSPRQTRIKIYMVTGLHDPRWLPNVLINYTNQTYPGKRLIIVENGLGIGACRNIKLPRNTIVISSEIGPAQPLNAALNYLRKQSGDPWFCKTDADDYYGPEYLNSILPAIKSNADFAGKSALYVRTTDNHLWFVDRPESHIFHGPTIAARVKNSIDFPLVKDWGEDEAWCRAMHQKGRIHYSLAVEHFCYQRHSNYMHSWPCTDIELRTSWQIPITDIGIYDQEIVNGKKPRPAGKIMPTPIVTPENFMPMRLLKERMQHRKSGVL